MVAERKKPQQKTEGCVILDKFESNQAIFYFIYIYIWT